jgi:hypothetical protein
MTAISATSSSTINTPRWIKAAVERSSTSTCTRVGPPDARMLQSPCSSSPIRCHRPARLARSSVALGASVSE